MRTRLGPIRLTEGQYKGLVSEQCGICTNCRSPQESVEPDARGYTCELCDAPCVYGTEELLLNGGILIVDADDAETLMF